MKAADFFRFLRSFFIQWHITERCNWKCKHCYQDPGSRGKIKDLSFNQLKHILFQSIELFKTLRIKKGHAIINIGGGEPFIREDFFDLLYLLNKYKGFIRVGIMTNGSFITEKVAKDLSGIEVLRHVQVSLEGLEETNDEIRGKGAFGKTINAIKVLRKYNIPVRVSMTVTRKNVREIEPLAIYLKKIGVIALGARRYVPMGRGEQLKEEMLTPLETRDFYFKREELRQRLNERGKFYITHGCEDGILYLEKDKIRDLKRSLRCGVVDGRGFTIFANGDIYACRRFPSIIGNVLKENLFEAFFSSDKLWSYRDADNAYPLCKECPVFKDCLGGAKCISNAYFKDPFAPDPQCWRLFKDLPDPNSVNINYEQEA